MSTLSLRNGLKWFVFLIMLPAWATAQQSYPDRLKDSLKVAVTDSVRYWLLAQLGLNYLESNPTASLNYFEKFNTIAQNNGKTLALADGLSGKAYLLMQLIKLPESFTCLEQAEKLASNPDNANKYWHYAHPKLPLDRLSVLIRVYLNMGHLMGMTGNTEQAVASYHKTITLATKIGYNQYLGLADMALGGTYLNMNKADSALLYAKKAEHLFKETGFKTYLGDIYEFAGNVYITRGNTLQALQYYHRALGTDAEQNNLVGLGATYADLTLYYLQSKQPDSSLFYARKTLAVRRAIGMHPLGNTYENLYKSYRFKHQTDSATKYLELALTDKELSFDQAAQSLIDFQKLSFKNQMALDKLEKEKSLTQSRIRIYFLCATVAVLFLLALLFYRNNRLKRKANTLLQEQKEEIEAQRDQLGEALKVLKATQAQLIQSEKMASLGELTAGIAHEIQNPLNFVNNFSEVSTELMDELDEELGKGDTKEAQAISSDIRQNLVKIHHHGKRADSIVKGMLENSRPSAGRKQRTDLNKLADEYLRLAYHGLRAKDKDFNAELITHLSENLPLVNIIPQDIGRVLLNVFNNAFYAVQQKQMSIGAGYKPAIEVSTVRKGSQVEVSVKDNGIGIPEHIRDKIMQPFFTTKPTGEGTGLGLSLSYDIVVKGHMGTIHLDTEIGKGSAFIISLPI